jgi:UDPglucose 6-dehydrogenase
MRICVFGLWHLGSVTSACLSAKGHQVVGLDFDQANIAALSQGNPPLFEPGLEDLTKAGLERKTLQFTSSPQEALKDAEVLWVTFDTPVDENDVADVDSVVDDVASLFDQIPQGCTVLISSQVPVGTTKHLQQLFERQHPTKSANFAYSPENLRLGSAIKVFTEPDRIVVGVSNERTKTVLTNLLTPITDRVEWMQVASAEMVKHATNAFLATSVTFINEVATLCEYTGADAKEVERGLKTEMRIGPKAYLSPGGAFAGGTLARDISFLSTIATRHQFPAHLLRSVAQSNLKHKEWAHRRLRDNLGDLPGKTVAVWGLTYKPGTDTLRRSSSIELCRRLAAEGVIVHGFDPAVKELPAEMKSILTLSTSPVDAARGADALVVATEWPEFREVDALEVSAAMRTPLVLDANRSLFQQWCNAKNVKYLSVGKPS